MKSAQEMADEWVKKESPFDIFEIDYYLENKSIQLAFLAGHSSRDAEVKALEDRIKDLAFLLQQE